MSEANRIATLEMLVAELTNAAKGYRQHIAALEAENKRLWELLKEAAYQWGSYYDERGEHFVSTWALSTLEFIFAELGLEDRLYTEAEFRKALEESKR